MNAKHSIGAILLLVLFAIGCSTAASAQDCSEITKKGIFDVGQTNSQSDLVEDIIHWLSVNEILTQEETTNAAYHAGIVIPNVPVPINEDLTYGSNRKKYWSQAAAEYLQHNVQAHASFQSTFTTANPNVVAAWQACVLRAKGLICWAKQTDNPNEIILNLEVRPFTSWSLLAILFLRVQDIAVSDGVVSKGRSYHQLLGVGGINPYLFTRPPGQSKSTTFVIYTNNRDYKCTAEVPSTPSTPVVQAEHVPHHNSPPINFMVAFDNKIGADKYGNGEWTRTGGIETIGVDFQHKYDDVGFKYTCHMEGKGDQPTYKSGQTCGQQGQHLHLEQFSIELTGQSKKYYDVYYWCVSAGEATPRWGLDGSPCGTTGELKQLQRAKVTVVAKDEYKEPE